MPDPPKLGPAIVGPKHNKLAQADGDAAVGKANPVSTSVVDDAKPDASTAQGGFDATPGTSTTKPPHRGASAALQMVSLRASPKAKEPTKRSAGMALFGVDLARFAETGKKMLKTAVAAALVSVALCNTVHDVAAQTAYVNVNGSTVASSEWQGAKQAAQEHSEKFSVVKPAELEKLFQAVDAGQPLRKLVISGHSSGLWFSGSDDQGSNSLSFDEVKKLAQQYPKAAAKVQLFFAMACNVGTEDNSRQWMEALPSVKALVGFDHIAPAHTRPAAKDVLVLVDRELSKVDFTKLTRAKAGELAARLSNLPGVAQTEFAIRLRANDGSTVFFSKINKPSSLTAAEDVAAQFRSSAFTPYLQAQADGFKNPPTSHGADSPLRHFYNASQDLLSALGRDITAQGGSPQTDTHWQAVQLEKEQALKLIYWQTLVQNAEHHMRPKLDAVVAELAAHGVDLKIPKLTTLTRAQIIEIASKLDAPAYFIDAGGAWDTKNAADLALVNGYQQQHFGSGAFGIMSYSKISLSAQSGAARVASVKGDLQSLIDSTGTPADVKAAAQRLRASLDGGKAVVDEVRALLQDGLRDLKDGVIPPDWITTDRPNV